MHNEKCAILENVATAKCTHDTLVLFRLNYDAHAKFEVAQPIRCRLIMFLLLIRYVWL